MGVPKYKYEALQDRLKEQELEYQEKIKQVELDKARNRIMRE